MGRHGKEEFDSYVLIRLCKLMLVILMVVQILLMQQDVRRELSLVDKLEGSPLVDGCMDERPLSDKILAAIFALWAGKSL